MSEPQQYLKYPEDVSIVRCCASCKHGQEAYGYEWYCDLNKYKREVLGKKITEEKGTEPYYICKDYIMQDYLKKMIPAQVHGIGTARSVPPNRHK